MNTPFRGLLAGMGVAAVVFVAWLALAPGSFWVDLAIALVAGAIAAVVVAKVFPYDAALVEYEAEARRRVGRLHKALDAIDKKSRRVKEQRSRRMITDGTQACRNVVKTVQVHDPSSVASTTAALQDKVAKLANITDGYLRYQSHPELPASRERLAACQQGFANFETFAQARLQQALDGNLRELGADLRGLEPIDTLTLGDTHA